MSKRKRNLKGDSLKLLAARGWLAGDVEQWIPGTRITRDLWGLFDVLACHPEFGILGLQVTNSGNLGNHISAALHGEGELNGRLAKCLRSGMRVEYWGWRPNGTILTRTLELSACGGYVTAFDGSEIISEEND